MSGASQAPPGTYAEWLPLLDEFASGDDSVITLMRSGSIVWSSVVAERLTVRVDAALNTRLSKLNSKLQKGLDRSAGDLFAVSRALLDARRELKVLHDFGALPCIPPSVQNHLQAQVVRFVSECQTQLERSASQIRHDGGRLLKVIRDNPLRLPATDFIEVSSLSQQNSKDTSPPARGRRVIL